MRKLAPAFIITTLVLASGSAFAMGDMKHKKSPSTETTATTSSSTSMNAPSVPPAPTPAAETKATVTGGVTYPSNSANASTSGSVSDSTSMANNSASGSTGLTASTDKPALGTTRDKPNDKEQTSTYGANSNAAVSAGTATTMDSKKPSKQVARNDARCDASKLGAGMSLPKDCSEKSGTGAAAVNSTQKQSGGSSGSSGSQ